MSDKEIQKYIKQVRKEANEDIKKHMERYVGAISEDFQDKVSALAEQISGVQKTVDSHTKTLDSHTEMIGSLMINVDIVKSDIEIIKNDLKQKVDRSEFEALVKRVALVEKRILK